MFGPRGFLSNYPADVCYVVNGIPITRGDILRGKRERQARELERKRRPDEATIKLAYIWVFDNGPILPYGGTWLYVRTHKKYWCVNDDQTRLEIMKAFPCGLLPMVELFGLWKERFIECYHRAGPRRQGMALCRVEINYYGQLARVVGKNGEIFSRG